MSEKTDITEITEEEIEALLKEPIGDFYAPHDGVISGDDLAMTFDKTEHQTTLEEDLGSWARKGEDPIDQGAQHNRNRIGRALVTLFVDKIDPAYLHPKAYFGRTWDKRLTKVAGQFEICPSTNALHIHLYLVFTRDARPYFHILRKTLNKDFVTGVNIARPTSHSANSSQFGINYCLAEEKRAPGTDPFVYKCSFDQSKWELRSTRKYDASDVTGDGNDSKRPAKKSKSDKRKEDIIEYIESKPIHWTWHQIVHENRASKVLLADNAWGKRFHEGRVASLPLRVIEQVVILYGAAGTGKTTLSQAYDEDDADTSRAERYYLRNLQESKFWGSGSTAYLGQRVIHLEEFNGQVPLSEWKELSNVGHSGPPIAVKYGGTTLNHNVVIFSSNLHPAYWYHRAMANDHNQWPAFARRVTKILFFPSSRPDGTKNLPDDSNPPHFLDQTTEWKDSCQEYDGAVAHAEKHWPRVVGPAQDGSWGFNARESQWMYNGNLPRSSDPQPANSRP
jgi:hypothetical protein